MTLKISCRAWVFALLAIVCTGHGTSGHASLSGDQYSSEDLERLKVVLIKGQETAGNVPKKDLSVTSSIYQAA